MAMVQGVCNRHSELCTGANAEEVNGYLGQWAENPASYPQTRSATGDKTLIHAKEHFQWLRKASKRKRDVSSLGAVAVEGSRSNDGRFTANGGTQMSGPGRGKLGAVMVERFVSRRAPPDVLRDAVNNYGYMTNVDIYSNRKQRLQDLTNLIRFSVPTHVQMEDEVSSDKWPVHHLQEAFEDALNALAPTPAGILGYHLVAGASTGSDVNGLLASTLAPMLQRMYGGLPRARAPSDSAKLQGVVMVVEGCYAGSRGAMQGHSNRPWILENYLGPEINKDLIVDVTDAQICQDFPKRLTRLKQGGMVPRVLLMEVRPSDTFKRLHIACGAQKLQDLLDRHSIALVFDEIMTGLRCCHRFLWEDEMLEMRPKFITFGKCFGISGMLACMYDCDKSAKSYLQQSELAAINGLVTSALSHPALLYSTHLLQFMKENNILQAWRDLQPKIEEMLGETASGRGSLWGVPGMQFEDPGMLTCSDRLIFDVLLPALLAQHIESWNAEAEFLKVLKPHTAAPKKKR